MSKEVGISGGLEARALGADIEVLPANLRKTAVWYKRFSLQLDENFTSQTIYLVFDSLRLRFLGSATHFG